MRDYAEENIVGDCGKVWSGCCGGFGVFFERGEKMEESLSEIVCGGGCYSHDGVGAVFQESSLSL